MSAIDWLSDTVAPARVAAPPPEAPAKGSPIETISTSVLSATNSDAAGVLPVSITGLPRGLWAASPMAELNALLLAERLEPLPALRDLFQLLLLAELDPPADADGSGRFLLARIDKLLELGALDAADALIDVAGPLTPDLFRRAFDTALLIGTEDAACNELRRAPGIAPTFPARVFCLARGGDWQAASLTFDTARALGQISPEDQALLERFLDPALFEDDAPLPTPQRPTPLTLRMFEAVGEPLSPNGLPLAFAHAELSPATGWKARLEAGERLARVGAIAPSQMFALYTERKAAASGGVWTRVDAVQRFDAALIAADPQAVAAALPAAWAAMQDIELEVPFAEAYSEQLLALALTADAAELAWHIALLSPQYEEAALAHAPTTLQDQFLHGIARGNLAGLVAPDSMARAIAPAFAPAPAALPADLERMLTEQRLGEAMLHAMDRVAYGATGDLRGVTEGLALLRRLGLEDVARRAALQLMILERRG